MGHFDHDEVRAARARRRLSQAQAAEALGVGRKVLMRWEAGESEPALSQAVALATLYDIPVTDLIVGPVDADGTGTRHEPGTADARVGAGLAHEGG